MSGWKLVVVVAAASIAGAAAVATRAVSGTPGAATAAVTPRASSVVSAPGRVEGAGNTIDLLPAIDGTIRDVLVSEGGRVRAGETVARLDCADLEADSRAAAARVLEAEASLARLLRGGRDDARAEARAIVAAAEARLTDAQRALDRAERLFTDDQIIPRAAVDEAERNAGVAAADVEAARQHASVASAAPLEQERAAAEAAVAAAQWSARAGAERLTKCRVVSPIDGVVLRRYLEPGERVVAWSPQPILSIADVSSFRVRVEVDERDLGALRVGQRVDITAEALGDTTLHGVVARIGSEMGRQHVRSGDPAEKADRDVLEVIVNLDDADSRLVVGLRVTAKIYAAY